MIFKINGLLTILLTIVFSCNSIKKDHSTERFSAIQGIYIEKVSDSDTSQLKYSVDNKIYVLGRKFTFDYSIVRNHDSLKITSPKMIKPGDDPDVTWDFINRSASHSDKIETISISVMNGISNGNQTLIKYDYQFPYDSGFSPFSSTSGIIENELNIWLHPHRDKYFRISQLNPFPFIQKPFEIGNQWKWYLEIGDHWQDSRWKTWTGLIKMKYEYEIIARKNVTTQFGKIECWIVKGKAKSKLGTTELLAYFNESLGFVKMDYSNIDGSQLFIELKKVDHL